MRQCCALLLAASVSGATFSSSNYRFRRPSWFLASDLGAGCDIVADLLERSGKDRPVVANRFVSEIQTCMHDHFYCGRVTPFFFSHLLDAGKHVGHDGYRKKNRIPSVRKLREAFQRLRDERSQINRGMRLLHGLQVDERLRDVEKLSVELDGVCSPDGLEERQKLVGHRAARRSG